MSFFRPVLLLIGCIHLAIGPSNGLQLFAWTSMLIDYSDGRTLAEAAEMTFDGEHPCSLCLSLKETREEEQNHPTPRPEQRLDRHHLFPQEEIRPQYRRAALASNSPPSPTALLRDCRFIPELTTPPPQET